MNGIHNVSPARSHQWPRLALAVVAFGLLASACGHSGSPSSTPTTSPSSAASTTAAPASTTTTAATTTAASTTTTAPAATTTVPATTATTALPDTGKGACPSAALSVRLGTGNGAAGSTYYAIIAKNIGSITCDVGGYFGVSVWNPGGHLLSADDQRQPTTTNGAPVRQVALAPGAYASFVIRLVDATCTNSSPQIGAFHFIPPNDTTFDQVSESRRFLYCGDGISVYPVVAGKTGA
jgi:hypothetical protein